MHESIIDDIDEGVIAEFTKKSKLTRKGGQTAWDQQVVTLSIRCIIFQSKLPIYKKQTLQD